MEAFSDRRSKVNGTFLAKYNGDPVTILGFVTKVHPNGSSLEMKSTDNIEITVILPKPIEDFLEGWIEVRGTGQGKCHVVAQHILPLPEDMMSKFDASTFDDAMYIINLCDSPWAP